MKRIVIGLFVLGMVAVACTGSRDAASVTTTAAALEQRAEALAPVEDATFAFNEGDAVAVPAGPLPLPPPDVRVIRDAYLQVRIEEGGFDQAWNELRIIALDSGGYISNASTGIDERGEDRYVFGTATLRIPEDRFDSVLDRLNGLGERLSLEISSQDVTEEFVDLEARLRHWRAVEEFHLGLLEEAKTVEEALRVQNQLQDVQLAIEQIEGRLRYLESRTSFATITVFATEAPAPPPPVSERSEIAKALSDARQVLLSAVGFVIVAAATIVPFGILAMAAYLVWRLVLRRRFGAEAQKPEPEEA
ncbi:MAG: DUF4349 domain-containing protein [Acidimicrobiia bacterium]